MEFLVILNPHLKKTVPIIYSFTQEICIEYILYAGYSSRHWECRQGPSLCGAYILWGRDSNK